MDNVKIMSSSSLQDDSSNSSYHRNLEIILEEQQDFISELQEEIEIYLNYEVNRIKTKTKKRDNRYY